MGYVSCLEGKSVSLGMIQISGQQAVFVDGLENKNRPRRGIVGIVFIYPPIFEDVLWTRPLKFAPKLHRFFTSLGPDRVVIFLSQFHSKKVFEQNINAVF